MDYEYGYSGNTSNAVKSKEMTPDAGIPIYRFKPEVECVLTERGGQLTALPAEQQRFTLAGVAPHPDGGQPTYLGEIWSGVNDGLRFWLEPGWYERINEWADPT